ncbi:hypothetical protein GCK72_014770 [Caenorhabditis remanei]|uniref:Uncharacterized protein n=1 Tax=Caenorhabditis remanei TaxID=31234 RepID=A0A6A5GVC4_CAERE|nr:hypothetical protein GCK72_014770 [Caenorhabditis remanei]KAF1758312.1 hypothetical protein GCK72_014770 [Caenorhabditis remanei]
MFDGERTACLSEEESKQNECLCIQAGQQGTSENPHRKGGWRFYGLRRNRKERHDAPKEQECFTPAPSMFDGWKTEPDQTEHAKTYSVRPSKRSVLLNF